MSLVQAIDGCLIGGAVGDALGLPRESMSAQRAERLFGATPYRMCLVGRWSTTSDDTEHACLTAHALLTQPHDVEQFARQLAWRLRWWFAALPCDAGWATLKACARLWAGWSPRRSGVRSAGNGAAMRAPILGVYFWDHTERLREFVDASTQITHRDPRAIDGAWLIALAASIAVRDAAQRASPEDIFAQLVAACRTDDLREALMLAEAAHRERDPVQSLATKLGCLDRVNGFICHTVPVVILAWLVHRPNYRAAVESVIRLGGDTDTHAALVGALCGISAGVEAIPPEWQGCVINWPRTMDSVQQLACDLDANRDGRIEPRRVLWPAVVVRNLLMLMIVLAHGFRRLLPPY